MRRPMTSLIAAALLSTVAGAFGPTARPTPRRSGPATSRKPLAEHRAALLAAEDKRQRKAERRRQLDQRLQDRYGEKSTG